MNLPKNSENGINLIHKTYLFFLFCFIFNFPLSAQLPIKQWDYRFGGTAPDYMQSLLQTNDGGYILGGYSSSAANGDKSQGSQGGSDMWIVKINAAGAKQWDKRFGGTLDDNLLDIRQTSDGGYILGGYSKSGIGGDKTQASQGKFDYWIVKTDANGVKQWDKSFGGADQETLTSLQQTTDGGYILGGYTNSEISGDVTVAKRGQNDYWIVKTDAAGVKQWDARFGGKKDDVLGSMQQTADGGYILGGYSYSNQGEDKSQNSHGLTDYWIVKTNVSGVKQWDLAYGGNSGEYLSDLQQTSDGGYIFGGNSTSQISGDKTAGTNGSSDFWIVKTDGNGVKQWDKTFGGNEGDALASLKQTIDGGYILAGSTFSGISGDKTQPTQGSYDYWMVKTNANGVWKFDQSFGSSSYELPGAMQQTSDGGFVMGGSSNGAVSGDKTQPTQGDYDYWVVKTTAGGALNNIYVGTITPLIYLQGSNISIPYTANGTYNAGNVFKAQLSDGAGNFESGIYIGSITSTSSGTIAATIPSTTANGTEYRIRVISSNPSVVSVANANDITVGIYPVKQWDYRFGSTSHDWFESMQPTSDGGFIMGGYNNAGVNGDKTKPSQGTDDYWVVKTDANGIKQWDAVFGGSDYDRLHAVCQTSDGGYLFGGETYSGISGDVSQANKGGSDYWIVKTDANGAKQWDKRFGSQDYDNLKNLQQTTDGGYILGGYTHGSGGDKSQPSKGGTDYWIVKINANGIKEWDKDFGGTEDDNLFSLHQTSDGGYILGGESHSGIGGDKTQANKGGLDYWIVKIDANGIKQWDASLGGSSSDYFSSVQQTSDGGYIVGGASSSEDGDKSQSSKGGSDYWIVKTDANGVKQWDATLGGDEQEYEGYVTQTNDGGYVIAGSTLSGIGGDKTQPTQGATDYWIVKTDGTGGKVWDARFGGNVYDDAFHIYQTADGGYVIGGRSDSHISGDKSQDCWGGTTEDYWIVKIDAGTGPGCLPPTGLSVSNLTTSSATLSWNAAVGAEKYKLRYKVTGTNNWTINLSTSTSKTITGLLPNSSYTWQVQTICQSGLNIFSDWSAKQTFSTSLRLESQHYLSSFELFPNPVSTAATIIFNLTEPTNLKIELFDLEGKKIKSIAEGNFDAGNHQLNFSSETLLKGIYLIQIRTSDQIQFLKIIKQ